MSVIRVILLLCSQIVLSSQQVLFRDTPDSRIVFPFTPDESYCDNTCQKLSENNPTVKCKCDRYCSVLRDCCVDASYRGRSKSTKMECLPPLQEDAIYTITRCKKRWGGSPDVSLNCTRTADINSDPFGQIPVTNTVTGATYKNYYCALCNDDISVTHWQLVFRCSFKKGRMTENDIMDNIVYSQPKMQWGLWMANDHNVSVFYGCNITASLPEHLQDKVRRCYGVDITTCPTDWEDTVIRRKCDQYLDPVTAKGVKYRNPHCAACNGIEESELLCFSIYNRTARPNAALPNFTMLFDFNSNNCDQGGGRCPCGETWDGFFKKCRKIANVPFR